MFFFYKKIKDVFFVDIFSWFSVWKRPSEYFQLTPFILNFKLKKNKVYICYYNLKINTSSPSRVSHSSQTTVTAE